MTQCKPLVEAELPEPQDLSSWWLRVETAIESLDTTFVGKLYDESSFGEAHVAMFGPAVLGVKGWQ